MRFPGNDPGIRFGIAPRTAAPLQAPALVTLRCHYMAKKYKNHGKKVARSFVFPFFQCRNIFFSGARGKRAVAARGSPCPQVTRRCTLCPQQFADTADCPAGNTANPPASPQRAGQCCLSEMGSKPPAPPQRAGQCCLSAGKGVSGRAAGEKRFLQNPYNFLTIH